MSDGPLSPEEVAHRGFGTSFRGFDTTEVRAYLQRVANDLKAATARERELHKRLADAEHRAAHPVLEGDALTRALGDEMGRILASAQEAANGMRDKAEENAARILRDAHEQAQRIRAQAEAILAVRTEEAETEAAGIRTAAAAEAAAVVGQAGEEASAAMADVESRAHQLVHDAQAARARVLGDLTRRRRLLQTQVEQLRAGRDRLLEAYRKVRSTTDEVADELQRVEDEARQAAGAAGERLAATEADEVDDVLTAFATGPEGVLRGGEPAGPPEGDDRAEPSSGDGGHPGPVSPAGATVPFEVKAEVAAQLARQDAEEADAAALAAEAAAVEAAGPAQGVAGEPPPHLVSTRPGGERRSLRLLRRAKGEGRPLEIVPAPSGDEAVRVIPPWAEPVAVAPTEPVGVAPTAEPVAVAPTAEPVAEPVAVPPTEPVAVAPTAEPVAVPPTEPVAVAPTAEPVAVAPTAEPVAVAPLAEDPDAAADAGEGTPAAGLLRPDADGAAVLDRPPAATAAGAAGAAGAADSSSSGAVPDGPDGADAGAGPREPAPGHAGGDAAEPSAAAVAGVDELFARIRAGRADAVARAHEVLAADPGAPGPPAVAADPPESQASDGEGAAPSDASSDDAGDPDGEALLRRRDTAVEGFEAKLARKLKRAMQDEQNEILDRLRSAKAGISLETVLPAPEDQARRYRHAADEPLRASAAAGIAFVELPGDACGRPDVPDIATVVTELVSSLAEPLRRALGRAVRSDDADQAAAGERIGAAYRECKAQRIEGLAGDAVTAAFSCGALAALPEGAASRWIVDDDGRPCPDCDDNALAGPTPSGEVFPTGQAHPPAHAGCRCLLAPAALAGAVSGDG